MKLKKCKTDGDCTKNYVCSDKGNCVKKSGPTGTRVLLSRLDKEVFHRSGRSSVDSITPALSSLSIGRLNNVNLSKLTREIEARRAAKILKESTKPRGSVTGQIFWNIKNLHKKVRDPPTLRADGSIHIEGWHMPAQFPIRYRTGLKPHRYKLESTTTRPIWR